MPLPRAIFFDMDGTLTAPMLDFDAIRRDIGLPAGQPILEAMARMSADDRRAAGIILHRHEEIAARQSTLNPGCRELLAWTAGRRVPTAVITRNSRASVQTVLTTHGLLGCFATVIAREDAAPKPAADPLLLACERLNVPPANAWMIGDGRHDIEAGHAAGVPTVWLSHGQRRPFAAEPWRVMEDLFAVAQLLVSPNSQPCPISGRRL